MSTIIILKLPFHFANISLKNLFGKALLSAEHVEVIFRSERLLHFVDSCLLTNVFVGRIMLVVVHLG